MNPAQATHASTALRDPADTRWVEIAWGQRTVRIEHQWIEPQRTQRPLMVFLHEGLGSCSMWRGFPQRLCEALDLRGLVYSRPGYGQSTPRAPDERWAPDFMHRQALEVLPALLAALGVDDAQDPPWLFGHSDGGSIALLRAAHAPARVGGVVALAPHIVVEAVSVTSIRKARAAYENAAPGNLRERLARHHDNPDSAFYGWNDIWLDAAFRDWSIEDELSTITCPLLALQGLDDEYGSLAQIHGITRRVPQARLVEIPQCGHSPHRDQPEAVVEAVRNQLLLT
jgi:pimeloyl-ACP methyl ester carboxylesterase